MAYQVHIAPAAERQFKKLDYTVAGRLRTAIERLAEAPRPPGCQAMRGLAHTFRIRVGDYRIIYEVQDARLLILVVRVGHRGDVYR